MDRRAFLTLTGGVVTVSLTGCLGDNGDDDTDSTDVPADTSTPEGVVVAYYEALNDADEDAIRAVLHDDGPLADEFELTEDDVELFEETTIFVESVEVIDDRETSATVEATFGVRDGDETETDTDLWTVRSQDGEWRIWMRGELPRPETTFEFEYTEETEELEISITGGDGLLAMDVSVTGENVEEGRWYEFPGRDEYTEVSELLAGDWIVVPAAPDYEVAIVWESEEWGLSETLAEDTGPDA